MTAAVARPFRVDRNVRLLVAFGTACMAQPGLAIWVVYLLDYRHLTLTQIGVMEAFYWGAKLLIEVPAGAVADRFGRRATFAVGAVIGAVGIATFAYASNFTLLLVSYLFWSGGEAFRSGNDQAYMYDALAAGDRTREFATRTGWYHALITLAFTSAGMVGGVLAAATSMQTAMIVGVVPYLAAAIALLFMDEPPRVIGAAHHLPYLQTLRAALGALRENAQVRFALLAEIMMETAMVAPILLLQPFLQQQGVSLAWFGVLQAPAALAGGLAAIASGRAAHAIGIPRLAGSAVAATIGGLVVLAAVDHAAAFAGFVAIQVALGLAEPAISGYANDRTDSNIRATIMSVVPLGNSLMFMIIGPFAGIIGDASLRLSFAGLAVVILITAVPLLVAWRRAEVRAATLR